MGDQGLLVSAGYLVVRDVVRPGYLDSAFPDRIVSASDHLAPIIPVVPVGWIEALDAPHGPLSGYADAAQGNLLWALEADLQRFGLDGARAADLSDFLTAAWAHGDFHPPSAFATLEAACRFVRFLAPLPEGAQLVGLALPAADVDAVARSDGGTTAWSRLPPCLNAPADGGSVLGFDVYALEDGDLRPWLRRRDAVERVLAAGSRPNRHGLFPTLDGARAAARALAPSGGRWLPWRLTAYPVAGT